MMENTINTTVKSKSVIINGTIHGEFKSYCRGHNLKIGAVIEDLINFYLNDPKVVQKQIDTIKHQ